uniref:Uncharacterized protein n=1 Tax=Vitis vinifera TaxID=29760 RepID=F6I084_VITVI
MKIVKGDSDQYLAQIKYKGGVQCSQMEKKCISETNGASME